uniref:DC-STAMP domain-containing protein 2 n=1 Tax=Euleptes europaea TaxID=460621 RepID=UPI0025411036|nr:DC-STAMP domain-containing protein 2 [Euleptes europaea]
MGLLSIFSTQQAKRRKKKPLGPRLSEDTVGRTVVRSMGGFLLGMTIAALYSAMVIFVQGYSIWYCMVSTISLAAGLGFGMAFSYKVRVTVFLVLPQMFSRESKTILLVLAFGLAMQGPFTNIMRNFTRSAEAVSCGAELALNQTAEMLQRAREPLLTALQKIKDIAKKAKVVGDRVRKLFRSVMDSVRHVAHCLRNVWYWLVNLGEVCNQELGSPYRKCTRIFDNAKDECERAIPLLYLLCYIVLLFKPLCGLANVLLVFCIIPQYIVPFLRRNVGAPISKMLSRIRREFEFNITTIHNYDVTVNASKSLSQVAFDIMEGISLRLQPVQEAIGLFGYTSTLAILYIYVKALLYRKCYLHEDSFDNIYITQQFLEMDAMRRKHQRPTVLPLSAKESGKYIRPASLVLPRHERLRYALALYSIFRHLIIVVLLIVGDYSVFWLFDLVRYQLHGEIVARAPVTMSISVTGTGYSGEMYRDMVSAFEVLQRGNISVLSKKCRLHPSEPDYGGYVIIGIMYGTCLFIAAFGSYVQRLRRVVCAWYYPSREQERVCYLYNTILTRRTTLLGAVLKAVRRNSADGGHTNLFLILAAKVPVLSWIVKRLGIHQSYCMGCGSVRKGTASEDFVTCITPGCRGLYCPKCYKLMNNICSICMGPLTFQGELDEEIDSSDEEAMALQTGAVKALRGEPGEERQQQRRELKRRIKRAVNGRGACRRLPPEVAEKTLDRLKEEGSSSSEDSEGSGPGDGSAPSSGSPSSLDFTYQDQAEASGSEGPTPESEELEEVKSEGHPLLKEAKPEESPRQEEEKSDGGPKLETEENLHVFLPARNCRYMHQGALTGDAFEAHKPTKLPPTESDSWSFKTSIVHQGWQGIRPGAVCERPTRGQQGPGLTPRPPRPVPKNTAQLRRARPVPPVGTGTALGGENAATTPQARISPERAHSSYVVPTPPLSHVEDDFGSEPSLYPS